MWHCIRQQRVFYFHEGIGDETSHNQSSSRLLGESLLLSLKMNCNTTRADAGNPAAMASLNGQFDVSKRAQATLIWDNATPINKCKWWLVWRMWLAYEARMLSDAVCKLCSTRGDFAGCIERCLCLPDDVLCLSSVQVTWPVPLVWPRAPLRNEHMIFNQCTTVKIDNTTERGRWWYTCTSLVFMIHDVYLMNCIFLSSHTPTLLMRKSVYAVFFPVRLHSAISVESQRSRFAFGTRDDPWWMLTFLRYGAFVVGMTVKMIEMVHTSEDVILALRNPVRGPLSCNTNIWLELYQFMSTDGHDGA